MEVGQLQSIPWCRARTTVILFSIVATNQVHIKKRYFRCQGKAVYALYSEMFKIKYIVEDQK